MYEHFRDEMTAKIIAIATAHGCTAIDEDTAHRSRYISISRYIVEDGEEVADVLIEARISNHPQRYSGAVWSFEPTDSEVSVARGLAKIEEICK